MREEDVPQEKNSTLDGNRKAVYAVGEDGQYTTVASDGWSAEEIVTSQVVEEFERLADEALSRAKKSLLSPLEYHMYNNRMDLALLSQTTGFFKWTIKRDFKKKNFEKMSDARASTYASVLGIEVEELRATL
ncbi:hypothetical protein GSY74_06435 [Sulfurovum sp. bin170]|uniref:hypothetical protein n=1 Tax=Sulfurovum sp. bin170 TaxID=2695268 RepID=UPI0013DF9B8B|nr:hypothetical protein [Sulfurovum sp. bin170]NEW60917.1 hypothetical protein [Sulfurovum sp. bin170]